MFGESEPTSENMEQENKVIIEETSVNLGYVKKELKEEFDFGENQYKIALTYENIFGETSKEQRNNLDSLIGFLDDDIIMKTETIKLEDVKEENKNVIRRNIKQSHCNRCGGNYEGYCPNCSSLSHILNNLTPSIILEQDLNSTPINMLEITEVSSRRAVFALKTLPKGIILGPFEGITSIESTNGLRWKIKNKKLLNDQNGNWMKYIESVANHGSKNLDVFQIDGILYFETSREIQEGEELLVCYREEKEEMLKSDREEEFYLVPLKKEEYPTVFACTLCCLGFRSEGCLVEHKSKCPQGDHGSNIKDFEIIQCDCCKLWLEKQEHLESHKLHCIENFNNRLSHNLPGFRTKNTTEEDKVRGSDDRSPSVEVDASCSTPTEITDSKHFCKIGCKAHKKDHFHGDHNNKHSITNEKKCRYPTKLEAHLKEHLNTHKDIKPFDCAICKKSYNNKTSLQRHIKDKHSNTSEKVHKCSECSYKTNRRDYLKRHLTTHKDIKEFKCDICKKGFTQKGNLKQHIRSQHSNTSEKEYKCYECPYQTIYKINLKHHLNVHNDIKPFECDNCKKRFALKSSLKHHIRNHHSNTNEKEHKCSECPYQTNSKGHLKRHLNTHKGIKAFECDICKKSFTRNSTLNEHIINDHSNRSEKEYKCSECSYQTNYKSHVKSHLNTHKGIKSFECDICKKRFTLKCSLKYHIISQHLSTSGKEYNCSECSYQTNSKYNLKQHLDTHNDNKTFECDICYKRFTLKYSLRMHIRNHHSNTSEKEYKCSECSYQTNDKANLGRHLNTHKDIKQFECDICKKGFTLKCSLKVHMRNQH